MHMCCILQMPRKYGIVVSLNTINMYKYLPPLGTTAPALSDIRFCIWPAYRRPDSGASLSVQHSAEKMQPPCNAHIVSPPHCRDKGSVSAGKTQKQARRWGVSDAVLCVPVACLALPHAPALRYTNRQRPNIERLTRRLSIPRKGGQKAKGIQQEQGR